MIHRRLFNIAALVSSLLFVASLALLDWSMDRPRALEFPWRDPRWEIAVGGGNLWIGNGPQARLEAEKIDLTARRLKDDYEWRSRAIHERVTAAAWGLAEYHDAIEARRSIDAAYERDRARLTALEVTRVMHSIQLSWIALILAALPLIWLVAWALRHRAALREARNPLCAAALVLTLLSMGILIVSIRSYWVGATWQFAMGSSPMARPTGWPANTNAVMLSGRVLMFSRGRIQLYQPQIPRMASEPITERTGYFRGGGIMIPTSRVGSMVAPPATEWWVPGMSYSARPVYIDRRGLVMMVGYRSVIFSTWMVGALLLVYPGIWFRWRWKKLRSERRRMLNLCIGCGYSLSGNTSGICPECGTTVQAISTTRVIA